MYITEQTDKDLETKKDKEDEDEVDEATELTDEEKKANTDEFENDEEFMAECVTACIPTFVQMMAMDEYANKLDENVVNAARVLQDYLVGQGVISETAGVPKITNKKITVVHLSKEAQIRRLKTIIVLKMGRKNKHKAYRKYKLGQKIKKANRAELEKIYGAKAGRLAKKLYAKLQRSKKANAIAADAKPSK